MYSLILAIGIVSALVFAAWAALTVEDQPSALGTVTPDAEAEFSAPGGSGVRAYSGGLKLRPSVNEAVTAWRNPDRTDAPDTQL